MRRKSIRLRKAVEAVCTPSLNYPLQAEYKEILKKLRYRRRERSSVFLSSQDHYFNEENIKEDNV